MPESFLFWIVTFAGAILCVWWLSVRPGASYRSIATPVSFLVIVMAVLLCLLALGGQDPNEFTREVYDLARGR